MAQATAINPGSIHICKARFSKLTSAGAFSAGSTSHFVTDQIISVDYTPVIKSGDAKEVLSGCDCVPFSIRGFDKLMRFELKFQIPNLAPALEELLLGSALLVDNSTIPVPVGAVSPNQVTCGGSVQPPVCAEFWTDAWQGDRQVDAPTRYIRWVWPMSFWQIEAGKLENDFMMKSFTGWTRANPNWHDAYGDWPTGIVGSLSPFAYFWDNTQPAASVNYSTLST